MAIKIKFKVIDDYMIQVSNKDKELLDKSRHVILVFKGNLYELVNIRYHLKSVEISRDLLIGGPKIDTKSKDNIGISILHTRGNLLYELHNLKVIGSTISCH